MNRSKRTAGVLTVLLCVAMLASDDAHAWQSCLDIFSTTYSESATGTEGGCQTCHQSPNGGAFNVFGDDLDANGAAGAGFNCTDVDFVASLRAVEGLNSDSDSGDNTNIEEIQADTQPGWCEEAQSPTWCNSAGTPPADVLLDPASPAPGNNPPVADAGGPYSGEAGTTLIQFDGSGSNDSDSDALSFAWDFGDGNNGSGMMPTHTYFSSGNFEVSLVVNDTHVDSDPAVTTASISAPPANVGPVADPGGPYAAQPGQAIVFDGSASSDPNGDALTYSWDFGDGAMDSGVAPSHAYVAAGDYTVSLTVNDGFLDSAAVTTTATISDPVDQSDGAVLHDANCLGCHGDPWAAPAVDDSLPGLRRVTGARSCNISGSIFGTSVFPNGVPEMQFLQGLTRTEIDAIADHLNSRDATGEQRYVTTCAGCHGNNGSGGRVDEDVHGDSANETQEAIAEEEEMHYLACMPGSDIDDITNFLMGLDDDYDDDGVDDDEDSDDDGDGINDDEDSDDDNDGVSDDDEREDGTDPRDDDSDDDGLDDGEEKDYGCDPNDDDTDDDGVSDGDEVKVFGTNPLVAEVVTVNDSGGSGGGSTNLPLLMLLVVVALVRRSRRTA